MLKGGFCLINTNLALDRFIFFEPNMECKDSLISSSKSYVMPSKNAILLLDDYNLINQEGVKWAVRDSGINIDKCVQTQSGQLICYT